MAGSGHGEHGGRVVVVPALSSPYGSARLRLGSVRAYACAAWQNGANAWPLALPRGRTRRCYRGVPSTVN
jgi:hypothetical protein